ncbi:hypothetical protein L208DRAFT_1123384, partial [Tricholoma matsutake]
MDIEAVLNPADESQVINETTDEDICWAVLNAKNTQEDGLFNGGDDNVNSESLQSSPNNASNQQLKETSVINWYIDMLDDPIACKLEGVLASFQCQMQLEMSHSMKS